MFSASKIVELNDLKSRVVADKKMAAKQQHQKKVIFLFHTHPHSKQEYAARIVIYRSFHIAYYVARKTFV
jgi:hypothetical protein